MDWLNVTKLSISKATKNYFPLLIQIFQFVSLEFCSLSSRNTLVFVVQLPMFKCSCRLSATFPTLPKHQNDNTFFYSIIPFQRRESETVQSEKKRWLFMKCWKIQYIDRTSERRTNETKEGGKNTKIQREKRRTLLSAQSLITWRDDLIYCQMCCWIINIFSQEPQSTLTSSRAVVSEMFI